MAVLNPFEQQRSLFASEFEQIKTVEDKEERAFYYALFGYDLITGLSRPLNEDVSRIEKNFTQDSSYESYILPGVGGNESYDRPKRVYYSPGNIFQGEIDKIGEYSIARVPQCYMYAFPLETNPLLYVSMTECSAIVAKSETHLYVAHIGLSEAGEIVGAVKYLAQRGVKPKEIIAHASIGDTKQESNVVTPHFDYRHAQLGTYLDLGISQSNIHPFEYRFIPGVGEATHHNTRGVFAGKDFQVAFSFDLKKQGFNYKGDKNLRDIVTVE